MCAKRQGQCLTQVSVQSFFLFTVIYFIYLSIDLRLFISVSRHHATLLASQKGPIGLYAL